MADSDKPLVELFLRAAPSDKKEKGACLTGQQWFMTLYCLVEKGVIHLRVTPMTLDVPPPNYLKLDAARHLPLAWVESGVVDGKDLSGFVVSSFETLEELIEKLRYPYLNSDLELPQIRNAEKAFEDLYIHFMQYVTNDNLRPLQVVLTNLENFLSCDAGPYILGDKISYADCQLMPKLQHIRVVGQAYKNFDVPYELKNVWNYIHLMYQEKAFIYSCPATRDILMHYETKNPLPKSIRPSLMGPEVLLTIPDAVHIHDHNGRAS